MPNNPKQSGPGARKPLTVAWISDYPIEWEPDLPEEVRALQRQHPGTWQMVLLREFERDPNLKIHVIVLRNRVERNLSFERNGAMFHVLKARRWLRLGTFFWLDVLLLRRIFRRIQPDLVHAWGNERAAGVVAQRVGSPNLLTIQGLFFWYNEQVRIGRYDRWMERFERKSLSRGDVVTTESRFAVQLLKERYPKLRVLQAEHAPNRVFREVRRRPEISPCHFIAIGGLGARKGTDLLITGLQRLSQDVPFRLTIVTGSALPAQTGAKEFWERVQFKRNLMPAEIARELETATMLLMPTRVDTSPNAVKEAVVAGVPVVASRVGGIPDYVFHEKNGILFEPGDLDGFIGAIRAACAHPLLGRGEVAPETLAEMRDYLSPERMARNFFTAYEVALGIGQSDEPNEKRSASGH